MRRRVQGGSLWAVAWNRLFDDFSSQNHEKWPENGQKWAVGAVLGAVFIFLAVAGACSCPLGDFYRYFVRRRHIAQSISSSLVERQRSPSAHLVRRRCGTPCWLRYSSAVPGFALQIVSAWFVTFVIQWWRVHCARGCQYIPCQRQGSGDPTPCGGYPGPPCWDSFSL